MPQIESVLFEELGAPVEPLSPEEAVAYFKGLVPTLGTDPLIFGDLMRRRAFTLAVATEIELLDKVQAAIADMLETGVVSQGPQRIQVILDAAGVTTRNPVYAEMVMRTNMMDSYNQASDEERMDSDVIDWFPVWEYSNPVDHRSRPHHAARDGKYYPAEVPFRAVRGLGIADAASCRCLAIPVFGPDWEKLQAAGKRVETSW